MTKIFQKDDLINALQPLPLDEDRKQAIIAALRKIQGPISPDKINDFITLLDFDSAVQQLKISAEEMNHRWRSMKKLQMEVNKYTTGKKSDLTPYIDRIIDYHYSVTGLANKRFKI